MSGNDNTFQTLYYGATAGTSQGGHVAGSITPMTFTQFDTSSATTSAIMNTIDNQASQPFAVPNNTPTKENEYQETRGQAEFSKKCISQFSLYADMVGDTRVSDPYDQLDAIEAGEFKPKISKSSKKRLRRMRQKHVVADMFKAKTAQIKRITKAVQKRRTKKALNKVINKLSKM